MGEELNYLYYKTPVWAFARTKRTPTTNLLC